MLMRQSSQTAEPHEVRTLRRIQRVVDLGNVGSNNTTKQLAKTFGLTLPNDPDSQSTRGPTGSNTELTKFPS